MASGVPVVSSRTSAIPEVAGESALLVDPTKPEEIAKQLIKLEEDEALYEEQVRYGLHRASRFSWRQAAEKQLGLYNQIKQERCSTL